MDHYRDLVRKAEDVRALKQMEKTRKWSAKIDWQDVLITGGKVIIVTSAAEQIVFVSNNMINMNGYSPDEVIGQKPSFFQGADTDPGTIAAIRSSIREVRPFDVSILNYKKNGIVYNCRIEGFPIFNKEGTLSNFIAFETVTG